MGTSLTSTTFLNDLLAFFRDHCISGLAALVPDAHYLVYLIGILEICMIWAAYFGELRLQEVIVKIFKIGTFFWLVSNWDYFTHDILFESFKMAGQVASNTSFDVSPSGILDKGLYLTSQVIKSICSSSGWQSVLGGLGLLIVKLIFALIIIVAFGFMAIQVLLVNIEFYLVSTLSVILVPFGLIKHTSFLFEKALGAMFSFGIKLMFMTFIVGLGSVLFDTWNTAISGDSHISELISASIGAVTYAFLVWKIPDIAAGALNGSPSLDGGDAMGAAKTAGGAALGAVSGGMSSALKIAGSVAAASKSSSGVGSFAKNLGVVGYNSAKYAAFGKNFIAGKNRASNFLSRHEKKNND